MNIPNKEPLIEIYEQSNSELFTNFMHVQFTLRVWKQTAYHHQT